MSYDEAMKLIEDREYASPRYNHGWAGRTRRLVKAACNEFLIRRGKTASITNRRANDWLWREVRKSE